MRRMCNAQNEMIIKFCVDFSDRSDFILFFNLIFKKGYASEIKYNIL